MPIILNPHIAVELTETDSDTARTGKVPAVAITVSYEVMFWPTDRKLPAAGVSFRERIYVVGVGEVGREALPVTLGRDFLTLKRKQTFVVERKRLASRPGVAGPIPVQCRIRVHPEPAVDAMEVTNTVTIPGPSANTQISSAISDLTRAAHGVRKRIIKGLKK